MRKLAIALLFGLIVSMFMMAYADETQNEIASGVVRLHIVAKDVYKRQDKHHRRPRVRLQKNQPDQHRHVQRQQKQRRDIVDVVFYILQMLCKCQNKA